MDSRPCGAPVAHQRTELERGTRRTQAMVLAADRDAKNQNDSLLTELVDRAAVTVDDLPRLALQPPHHFVDLLRSATLDEIRVPR